MPLLTNCVEIAFKYLSSVEIDKCGSNQPEFHGAVAFKRIFGCSKQSLRGTVYYIENQNIVSQNTSLTWYDARENNPNRSKYRFYYTCSVSNFKPSVTIYYL